MRTYLLFALAGALLITLLQALLPANLAPARATEVIGMLNHQLRFQPRGVALANLTSFAWDEVCTIRPEVTAAEMPRLLHVAVPDELVAAGEGWLLLFLRDNHVVTAARVPPPLGALEQSEPFRCIADPSAFLTVLDAGPGAAGRRFELRA